MTTDTSENGPREPLDRRAEHDRRPGWRLARWATRTTTTASTRRPRPAARPSSRRRSEDVASRSTSATTARRGGSSSPACRARSRSAASIDVLRNGVKHGPHHVDLFYGTPSPGNAQGGRALRRQPLQRHAAAPLQPRRDAARARSLPVRQRPAGRDVRAEEQPHQADGRGRGRAVQARPRPARAALRVRPLHRRTSPSTTRRSASAPT